MSYTQDLENLISKTLLPTYLKWHAEHRIEVPQNPILESRFNQQYKVTLPALLRKY